MHYLYEIIVKNNNCMKKIQYILLASLAIGAGASAASLPEEAAAMAEQFLSQKMGGKTADGGSQTAAVMSTSDKTVKKTKSLKKQSSMPITLRKAVSCLCRPTATICG